ncbi:hypothetical protein D3C83_329710 [compost metagenome]
MIVGVGDDPVTAHQLRRDRAGVSDGDGVGEDVAAAIHVGLVRDEGGARRNRDFVLFVSHAADS